jgi:rubrerythrin
MTSDCAGVARARLVFLIQIAYSAELAAAIAYVGHRNSLRDEAERADLYRVMRQEIRHRRCLRRFLRDLGAAPSSAREAKMTAIGTSINLFCRVGGWFFPMYGAGMLEAQNIREYEVAARLAHIAGRNTFVEAFLEMAEVEWDHERYFRTQAASHALWRVVPRWPPPPPRDSIRPSFDAFTRESCPAIPTVGASWFAR